MYFISSYLCSKWNLFSLWGAVADQLQFILYNVKPFSTKDWKLPLFAIGLLRCGVGGGALSRSIDLLHISQIRNKILRLLASEQRTWVCSKFCSCFLLSHWYWSPSKECSFYPALWYLPLHCFCRRNVFSVIWLYLLTLESSLLSPQWCALSPCPP